jgi:hypothetical protein
MDPVGADLLENSTPHSRVTLEPLWEFLELGTFPFDVGSNPLRIPLRCHPVLSIDIHIDHRSGSECHAVPREDNASEEITVDPSR